MDFCRQVSEMHLALWVVPTLMAILVSAIGSRLSRRVLAVLSIAGLAIPFAQACAAVVFFMWGQSSALVNLIEIETLTMGRRFALSFVLDAKGAWATLLCMTIALAAQTHAIASVARLAGRHRYHALILALAGGGGLLFCGRSMVPVLIGWEGLALAGAFLAGFWESEESGGRTGMRWLLFQRGSGVLLLLGFLALEINDTIGAVFIVAAVSLRAGQVPFHGWIPGSTRAPSSTTALVHGVGSLLAATFLLDRFWHLIALSDFLPELIGIMGASGVVLGILAGLQQHRPQKILGWMFMLYGGLAWLGFAIGDPVAARMIVTGSALALSGLVLVVGTSSGQIAEFEMALGRARSRPARRAYMVLWAALALPPSLTFLALGRLCGFAPQTTLGLLIQLLVVLCMLAVGWILRNVFESHKGQRPTNPKHVSKWMSAAPAGLGAAAFVLGLIAFFTHRKSEYIFGGMSGLGWAGIAAGSMVLGWLLAWWIKRGSSGIFVGRLSYSQRAMDRVAGTGLGIGEMIVVLPVFLLRAVGVVFWRGIGDFVLDTLIFGTAVRSIEGIGTVLRYIQNGRIQRYALVVVLATLLLVLVMLRY
ncbi:MAG: hypothetical protein JRJ87_17840 [Deltaproteobacteria bacterium]|nr:hypothetical protein [Deltaproteobacteria bacterium]